MKTKTVLPHTLAVHMIDALYFENLLAEVEVKFTAWVVRIRFGTEARGWGASQLTCRVPGYACLCENALGMMGVIMWTTKVMFYFELS